MEKKYNKNNKKDHPLLWKIQFYMESLLLSIGLLILVIVITMFIIYWFNFNSLSYISS